MMDPLFDDPRWDTFGLLKEAYLAVQAAMAVDLDDIDPMRPELRDLTIRLARTPGNKLRPSDLARSLSTTASSMTRLIDEGEKLGVLRRDTDPDDRRACLVALTAEGLATTEAWARASLDSSVTHVRDHLAASDVSNLEDMLRTIRDEAQRYFD